MSTNTPDAASAVQFGEAPFRARTGRMPHRPRLGFLGADWSGRNRMLAIARDGAAEVAAIADPDAQARAMACEIEPRAASLASIDALLEVPMDGLVIAVPDARHATLAEAALARGIAVFCQKPLGRTAGETRHLVDAARRADRLLAAELPYRCTLAMQRLRDCVAAGDIGEVFAVDLVFHIAYRPAGRGLEGAEASGGGCVLDLGTHLVDLALWTLGAPPIRSVSGCLHAGGRRLAAPCAELEDHAVAQFELSNGGMVRLACSWNRPVGRDAIIEAHFHGTRGGASFRNVKGSFYNFAAERFEGQRTLMLAAPPDPWEGRAGVQWVHKLAAGGRFDPAIEQAVQVAEVIDAIYAG